MADRKEGLGFRTFLLSYTDRWLTLMSGAPSVPLTIAAIFIESVWAKIGLAMLAVFCLGLASFLVWRQERERALGLEQRLKPKFTFGFVKSDTLCDVNTHFPDKEEVRFLRLRGETLTRSEVVNCSGRLTCIRKPDGKLMEVNLVLPFAPAEESLSGILCVRHI